MIIAGLVRISTPPVRTCVRDIARIAGYPVQACDRTPLAHQRRARCKGDGSGIARGRPRSRDPVPEQAEPRFERAAVRWLGRLLLEKQLPLSLAANASSSSPNCEARRRSLRRRRSPRSSETDADSISLLKLAGPLPAVHERGVNPAEASDVMLVDSAQRHPGVCRLRQRRPPRVF